jgi:hypothetical protein
MESPIKSDYIDKDKLLLAWELNVQTQKELLDQFDAWQKASEKTRRSFATLRAIVVVCCIALIATSGSMLVELRRMSTALNAAQERTDQVISQMNSLSKQISAVNEVSLLLVEANAKASARTEVPVAAPTTSPLVPAQISAEQAAATVVEAEVANTLVEVQAKALAAQAISATPAKRAQVTTKLRQLRKSVESNDGLNDALEEIDSAIEAAGSEEH